MQRRGKGGRESEKKMAMARPIVKGWHVEEGGMWEREIERERKVW